MNEHLRGRSVRLDRILDILDQRLALGYRAASDEVLSDPEDPLDFSSPTRNEVDLSIAPEITLLASLSDGTELAQRERVRREVLNESLPDAWPHPLPDELVGSASQLDLCGAGKRGSAAEVLSSLPVLILWENRFEARVSNGTRVDGLPVLEIFRPHVSSINLLAHAFALCVCRPVDESEARRWFVKEEHLKIATASPCDAARSERIRHLFGGVLRETLRSAANRLWKYPSCLPMPASERAERFIAFPEAIRLGAQVFVELHELGHVALGHTYRPPAPRDEFEADRFAARMIFCSKSSPSFKAAMLGGVHLLFGFYYGLTSLRTITDSPDMKAREWRLRLNAIEREAAAIMGEPTFLRKGSVVSESARAVVNQTFKNKRFLHALAYSGPLDDNTVHSVWESASFFGLGVV